MVNNEKFNNTLIVIIFFCIYIIYLFSSNIVTIYNKIAEHEEKIIKAKIENSAKKYVIDRPIYYIKKEINKDLLFKYIKSINHKISNTMCNIICDAIIKASKDTGLPIGLIVSVISVESHFNPQATSSVNACGLMQIHNVHKDTVIKTVNIQNGKKINIYVDFDNIYDPKYNILVGSYLLTDMINKCNCLHEALLKYVGSNDISKYPDKIYKKYSEFNLFLVSGGRVDKIYRKNINKKSKK